MTGPRILSLLPGATETVAALGLAHLLVGRSHECDAPAPLVARLPVLTKSKVPDDAGTKEVTQSVRALVELGLSIYQVDAERLAELAPDVILTQTQCEVCAASPRDLQEALSRCIGRPPLVVELKPLTLADNWRDISAIAAALDAEAAGDALIGDMKRRLDIVSARRGPEPARPRALCLEWLEPPMAGGNWLPELIHIAGGRCLFGSAGQHSPWIDWDDVRRADPEVLVLVPCGFPIPRTRQDLHLVRDLPGFAEIKAVQAGRAFIADGNRYFNRPGPALAATAEILAELLHPESCAFGHRMRAYEPI